MCETSYNSSINKKIGTDLLLYKKIDCKIIKCNIKADDVDTKKYIIVNYPFYRQDIFSRIFDKMNDNVFCKKNRIVGKISKKYELFNVIHDRILFFEKINLKVLLLLNDSDDKTDPEDNMSYYSNTIIYICINEYLTIGDDYLENKWIEIKRCIISQYLLNLTNNKLRYVLFDYFYDMITKNMMIINPSTEFEKLIIERCIMWLLYSMPYSLFKNANVGDLDWKKNIKLGTIINYIHKDSSLASFLNISEGIDNLETSKIADVLSYTVSDDTPYKFIEKSNTSDKDENLSDGKLIKNIIQKEKIGKDKYIMNWHELNDFISNTTIESSRKNIIHKTVTYLTRLYVGLVEDINYVKNIKERNIDIVLNSIKVTEKTKLGSTINKKLGAEFLIEMYNLEKYSTIERIKRWHDACRNTNRHTNYLICVREIVLLIEYNEANEPKNIVITPNKKFSIVSPPSFPHSNLIVNDKSSSSKNSIDTDTNTDTNTDTKTDTNTDNVTHNVTNIVITQSEDKQLLERDPKYNSQIEEIMKYLNKHNDGSEDGSNNGSDDGSDDDLDDLSKYIPSNTKNVNRITDLSDDQKKKEFYLKHLFDFKKKFNCELINGTLKTDWPNFMLFMMTSNYITFTQKSLLTYYLNCYNHFIESYVDRFYDENILPKFKYEDILLYSMITTIHRKPRN